MEGRRAGWRGRGPLAVSAGLYGGWCAVGVTADYVHVESEENCMRRTLVVHRDSCDMRAHLINLATKTG